jgi:hypothetical protein
MCLGLLRCLETRKIINVVVSNVSSAQFLNYFPNFLFSRVMKIDLLHIQAAVILFLVPINCYALLYNNRCKTSISFINYFLFLTNNQQITASHN